MTDHDQTVLALARAYRDARTDFNKACDDGGLDEIDAANRKVAKTAHDLLAAAREMT